MLATLGHEKTEDIARIKLAEEYTNMAEAFMDHVDIGLVGLGPLQSEFFSLINQKVPSGMHVEFVGQRNGSTIEQLRNKYQVSTKVIRRQADDTEGGDELKNAYLQVIGKYLDVMKASEDKRKYLEHLKGLQSSYEEFKRVKNPLWGRDLKTKMRHDLYYFGLVTSVTLNSFALDYLEGCKDKSSYGYNIQKLKILSEGYMLGIGKTKEMMKDVYVKHVKYMMKHFPQDATSNQLICNTLLQTVRSEHTLKEELYAVIRQNYHAILDQTPKYHIINKVTIGKAQVNRSNNLRIDKYFMDLSKIQLELEKYDHFIEDYEKYSINGFTNFGRVPYYEHALVDHLYYYCEKTKSYDKGYDLLNRKGVLRVLEDLIVYHALNKKQNRLTSPLVTGYTSAMRMLLNSNRKNKEQELIHHMKHFEKTYSFHLKQGKSMARELYWLAGEYSEMLKKDKKKEALKNFYESYTDNLSMQGLKNNYSALEYKIVPMMHAFEFVKIYYNLAAVHDYKKSELPQKLIEDVNLLHSRYMKDNSFKQKIENNEEIKSYFNSLLETTK